MSTGTALQIVREGILETLILAGPLLLIAMAVGLIIAILQATTSIQEQTLTFVPKIAAILIGLILLGRFLLDSLVGYTQRLFSMISHI
ncbi:MAG TPA: flagellar biosynthesis protein FliQ [Spirochaetia bacterium]|jgi:flagellar biosynthetic protein FliQ|nr:flagellar biosynthesis protein FliQ [Spirochaetia bacterium]